MEEKSQKFTQRNKQNTKKKATLKLIIFIIFGLFLSEFHTNIAEKIIESVNVNGIDLDILDTILEFLGSVFLIIASLIPWQCILSEEDQSQES